MRVTSPFGERVDPITGKKGSFHPGVDFKARTGDYVRAAESGTVIKSYLSQPAKPFRSYGQCIWIQHDPDTMTLYAHLSLRMVKEGTAVQAGQVIGLAGNTGDSTGPHLHFELRVKGRHVDPMPYFGEEKPVA